MRRRGGYGSAASLHTSCVGGILRGSKTRRVAPGASGLYEPAWSRGVPAFSVIAQHKRNVEQMRARVVMRAGGGRSRNYDPAFHDIGGGVNAGCKLIPDFSVVDARRYGKVVRESRLQRDSVTEPGRRVACRVIRGH